MAENLKEIEEELESFLERENIDILGKIPYNRKFISLLQEKKSPMESDDKSIIKNFDNMFNKILNNK